MGRSRRASSPPRARVQGTFRESPSAFADARGNKHNRLPRGDVETWLRTDSASAFDELRSNPSEAVTGDQMRADLADRHAERAKGHRRA